MHMKLNSLKCVKNLLLVNVFDFNVKIDFSIILKFDTIYRLLLCKVVFSVIKKLK